MYPGAVFGSIADPSLSGGQIMHSCGFSGCLVIVHNQDSTAQWLHQRRTNAPESHAGYGNRWAFDPASDTLNLLALSSSTMETVCLYVGVIHLLRSAEKPVHTIGDIPRETK